MFVLCFSFSAFARVRCAHEFQNSGFFSSSARHQSIIIFKHHFDSGYILTQISTLQCVGKKLSMVPSISARKCLSQFCSTFSNSKIEIFTKNVIHKWIKSCIISEPSKENDMAAEIIISLPFAGDLSLLSVNNMRKHKSAHNGRVHVCVIIHTVK